MYRSRKMSINLKIRTKSKKTFFIIYFFRLESIVQLFESRADLEYYCSLVMRLRIVKDLTSNEQQAILAYIVLFNMSSDEAVSHVPKVSSNCFSFSSCLRLSCTVKAA